VCSYGAWQRLFPFATHCKTRKSIPEVARKATGKTIKATQLNQVDAVWQDRNNSERGDFMNFTAHVMNLIERH